jgi:hypothetical protein
MLAQRLWRIMALDLNKRQNSSPLQGIIRDLYLKRVGAEKVIQLTKTLRS